MLLVIFYRPAFLVEDPLYLLSFTEYHSTEVLYSVLKRLTAILPGHAGLKIAYQTILHWVCRHQRRSVSFLAETWYVVLHLRGVDRVFLHINCIHEHRGTYLSMFYSL